LKKDRKRLAVASNAFERCRNICVVHQLVSENYSKRFLYILEQWVPNWGKLLLGVICNSSKSNVKPKPQCSSI